ncbi:hypothetical protein B0T22DRAFT_518671 [Podospora appendiculata]|uniref:Uncharacterized protein n=1 Tax=Podospora appendiculata TaxID=314037 RepID=A0AAE0X6G0_9PEZI|nr:hypothetical protein B0T22DRAFT_518671 [Podospora appendiculata]
MQMVVLPDDHDINNKHTQMQEPCTFSFVVMSEQDSFLSACILFFLGFGFATTSSSGSGGGSICYECRGRLVDPILVAALGFQLFFLCAVAASSAAWRGVIRRVSNGFGLFKLFRFRSFRLPGFIKVPWVGMGKTGGNGMMIDMASVGVTVTAIREWKFGKVMTRKQYGGIRV